MKLSFDYKGIKVTYYLTYKKAKAISINITEDGKVNVVAPIGTKVFAVIDKVKGNAPWIISELYAKQKIQIEPQVKLLEQYTYLGKNYKLDLNVNTEAKEAKVKMARGKFVVDTPTDEPKVVREAIVEWYKQKVSAKIKERIKEYSESFDKVPTKIELVDDNKTLFKANENEIVANAKFGILSAEVMDYILVSTLCHINIKDHNEEMKKVEELLPNYEKSKEWLETNKSMLIL